MAEIATTHIRLATIEDVAEVQRLYAETGLDGGRPLPKAAARDIFMRFARYPSYRLWGGRTRWRDRRHLCADADG